MVWKPKYEENRRAKMARDPEYAAKLKSTRSRTPEENKVYMAAYYLAHPEKFKRNEAQNIYRNELRRKRYAEDEQHREKCRALSRNTPKTTRRAGRIKIQYGLSVDDFNRLLSAQGGTCAICPATKGSARGEQLHIDHCHDTGVIRGLLCTNCNQGLGKFGDDPDRLMTAVRYLRSASANSNRRECVEAELRGPANDLLAAV